MADAKAFERARGFRRALTPPEARLWFCLRGRKLNGLKFRRQHPIGPFILDFYSAAAKLAVEVDGSIHDGQPQAAHDRRRTAWLAERGVRVIRLRATDVRDELNGVLEFIAGAAEERLTVLSSTSPRPLHHRCQDAPAVPLPIADGDGEEI